ncbi:serine carboxypeptidase S28-domain-containing protein [Gilbertella persicaria]|uniref:serine carboxypeptidase S28-domain-containing protein n=1 Tax=Gilbertella persicaria TaxID=101096 RepID=UPI00221F1B3A|nr:serine carboxypeptidase S28-domain-containing protein [Gilbertella persicaria]KAI8098181.1 serine carboxypeptidase S28-domain-containing protein [Gilbertella persicaria]
MRYVLLFLVLLSLCQLITAFYGPGERFRRSHLMKLETKHEKKLPEQYGPFYYDQPVDHFDSNSSTFKHRYWANTDHYEQGGPVVLYNAGETPADERSFYVINSTMADLARRLNGIVIVMEHRFYGKSMPAPDFSAKSLATLNTKQALEDMAHFIKFVKFPNLDLPPAPETKYIVYGGSYSGNLAAWMRQKYPDLVFAAVPSSAPVQMSYNYYQYFDPILQYGPKHCIDAIRSVVLYVDHILFSPFKDHKVALKRQFGVEELQHDDDFAELLSSPLGMWQAMTPTENPFQDKFCSIFDGLNQVHEYVDAYANYTLHSVQRQCKNQTITECLDTHDPHSTKYSDESDENRAWFWQVCTEYAYWQTASPLWRPTIVSRKLNTAWYQRQCPYMFGEHAVPHRPVWRKINRDYEGWYTSLDRVYWIDGEWDPWRTLSIQSEDAPDRSGWNENACYAVLPKSVHHWDFFTTDAVSGFIKDTQDNVFETIRAWIDEANDLNTPALVYQSHSI